jgi:mRNA interferase MazF
VKPGDIVIADWHDALPDSQEPHKERPAIVVGAPHLYPAAFPFRLVVPLTGDLTLAIDGASTIIEPTPENGCRKRSYAISWAVQCVATVRLRATPSRVTSDDLTSIIAQIGSALASTSDHLR